MSKEFTLTSLVKVDEDGNFGISLLHDGENNEVIDSINSRIEIYNDLYQDGEDKIRYMNDDKYTELISKKDEEIRKMRESVTSEFKDIMRDMEMKNERRVNFYKSQNDTIEEDMMTRLSRKEEAFDSFKVDNEERVKNLRDELQKKDDYYAEEIRKKEEYFSEQMSNMEELKVGINDISNKINFRSSADKGREGEDMMYGVLDKFFLYNPNVTYEMRSGFNREGDINLNYYGLKVCVDSKNYQKSESIRTIEIKKFQRDMNGLDFDMGIICSIYNIKFVGKNNFDVEIINGKPIIYVTNLIENKEILPIALHILKQVKGMNNVDDVNIFKQKIIQEITALNDLKKCNKMFKKALQDSDTIIDKSYNNLCVAIGMDMGVKKDYHCDVCEQYFNSEKVLNNHLGSKKHANNLRN